jgi:hypothetical protein
MAARRRRRRRRRKRKRRRKWWRRRWRRVCKHVLSSMLGLVNKALFPCLALGVSLKSHPSTSSTPTCHA